MLETIGGRTTKAREKIARWEIGGRVGFRTLGLLVANEIKSKLRRAATIT